MTFVRGFAALLGALVLAGPAAAAPSIDPELREELAVAPAVEAVVTTWTYEQLDTVERLGVDGTRLRVLPMLLTRSLTAAQLARLERSAAVRSVYANTAYEPLMEDSTWITRARYAWPAPAEKTRKGEIAPLGVTGEGVDVAVIDTGADGKHEDMDNLVEFCETQQAVSGDRTTVLCSPFDPASGNAGPAGPANDARLDSTDDEGHGTHVSGTIAGSGEASGGRDANHSTIGMAPDARLHVYSANIGPSLFAFQILAAYDDMISKKLLGLTDVVATSNSFGGGGGSNYDPGDPMNAAAKRAYDAGILSVYAAGNSGHEHDTLSRQCVNPWVVCVAASTKPDSIVAFSSRGRPSEPADTNRDGVVGDPGDVPPDNHDRALGQALELGLYRPTLAAPGVNVNSISANSATCREGPTPDSGCYEPLNGTSMATPHVSGAVALIVEAYRSAHGGENPTPAQITEILERSASEFKLPGWEAEEQGAGRLDAYRAVELARGWPKGAEPFVLGTATPPYEAGRYPGSPGATAEEKGCTGTLSWTAQDPESALDPVGQPPAPGVLAPRYGEHAFDVPANADRLRITVTWPRHPTANLYVRAWRPGVDPNAEFDPPGQTRVFADQEALGLLGLFDHRLLELRAPEGTTLEGRWIVRVYHRVGGAPSACDADSQERPKQLEGFNYELKVERPTVRSIPSVRIDKPRAGTAHSERFVTITGRADYPAQWDGITNWEAPGSSQAASSEPPPPAEDTRTILRLHGNPPPHDSGEPLEAACTGDGSTDVVACDGPYLIPEPEGANLAAGPAASWKVPDPLLDGTSDRNIYDPNWIWHLEEPTQVGGPMTVEWWASCGACGGPLAFSADWFIRLWADGELRAERRVTATPSTPNVAEQLAATIDLPTIVAEESYVVHVDPVYIDSQANTLVYYDSTDPCPTATGSEPCDSIVRMPVGGSGGEAGEGPAGPENVRVTDLHNPLRVAWDPFPGATAYEIHRSTDPAFDVSKKSRIATTAGTSCVSPDVPTWPSASRPGLCYLDPRGPADTVYYYRVVALTEEGPSEASELAYGKATRFDRQVKLKVDRLYGPGYWEYATLTNSPGTHWAFVWDTLELVRGPHDVWARSFTQGVGSEKDLRTYVLR